jgi:hypothetical protein
MIKAFDVRWLEHDETVITYSPKFETQDWLTKADILKDAIGILTERYDSVLFNERNLQEFVSQVKRDNHATK